MKHLIQSTLYGRRFNESKQNNLRDFCEANFAYLLDDGYEIQYKKMRAMYYSPGTNYEYYNINELEKAELDMVWYITIIVKI